MKRFLILILFTILITGCTTEEVTIKNPNGTSLTYKYFKKHNYNSNKYTLKLQNDKTKITIIKNNNKQYYESKTDNEITKTIEKNNKKYTILDSYYTEEPISESTNYTEGYLPESLKEYKNKTYKTGKERKGLFTYTYEKYDYKQGTIKYYFHNNELKYIEKESTLEKTELKFISISSKVDKTKFKIPNKTKITY